jgi:hypothetical protein
MKMQRLALTMEEVTVGERVKLIDRWFDSWLLYLRWPQFASLTVERTAWQLGNSSQSADLA